MRAWQRVYQNRVKGHMHYEDYRTAQLRIRGPLFGAQEALTFSIAKDMAPCDEGKALLEQARKDVSKAIDSVGLLLAYAARMNGFDD